MRDLVMFNRQGTADKYIIGGLSLVKVAEALIHLGRQFLHAFASLGTCWLANDLEHLRLAFNLRGASSWYCSNTFFSLDALAASIAIKICIAVPNPAVSARNGRRS